MKEKRKKLKGSSKRTINSSTALNDKTMMSAFSWDRLVLLIGMVVGYCYWNLIRTLFENSTQFSMLSEMEREMSFRTEQGLYYSYYKQLVNGESLWEEFTHLLNDDRTEQPNSINVLQRFNLLPELIIGILYRSYRYWMKESLLWKHECFEVNRGDSSVVISCVGLGEPIIFYSECFFLLQWLMFTSYFFLTYFFARQFFDLVDRYFSKSFTFHRTVYSILISIIACSFYLFHLRYATRVMWTLPLRETVSYPFHILQWLVMVSYLDETNKRNKYDMINWKLVVTNVIYLLTWQFAQFQLTTQIVSLFIIFSYEFVRLVNNRRELSIKKFIFLNIFSHFLLSFFLVLIFQFCQRFLFHSLLFYVLIFVFFFTLATILLFDHLHNYLQLFLSCFSSLSILMLVRFSIQSSNDDRHIWDILLAKFTNFQTFHTKLYLCAKEFDFLPKQTLIDLSISLLIPLASLTLLIILYFISKNFFGARQISENIHNYSNENVKERKEKEKKVVENHVFPLSLMLLLFQTIFHTIMALFIMRLQLFWTPTICIVAALFFLLPFYFMNHNRHIIYLLGGLMIWPCIVGSSNLKKLTAYHNSYENPEMEELFNWVNENTEKNAIFAGSMNVMANLKLSTNRRLFNHPHYENVQLRNRTYHLYKFYGLNTDVNKWVQLLRENHVNYFIADIARCQMPNKQTDCTLADMYLIDDYELSEEVNMKLVQLEQLLCFRLINRPKHLKQYKIHLKFTSSKSSHMVFEIH